MRSNTEVEYRVVMTTTQEIEAVRSMLGELSMKVPTPMTILMDNLSTSFIAWNPIGHIRLKHVALDLHFVRERMESGDLIVKHIIGKERWGNLKIETLIIKSSIVMPPFLIVCNWNLKCNCLVWVPDVYNLCKQDQMPANNL